MESMTPMALIGMGFFITIMLATILISALPRITIKLLEVCRLAKRGHLHYDKRNYVNGAGHHVYRGVYFSFRNGSEHFENMRVFLLLLIITLIPGILVPAVLMVVL